MQRRTLAAAASGLPQPRHAAYAAPVAQVGDATTRRPVENPAGTKFCGQCTTPLTSAAEPRFASPEAYAPKHLADRILMSRAGRSPPTGTSASASSPCARRAAGGSSAPRHGATMMDLRFWLEQVEREPRGA